MAASHPHPGLFANMKRRIDRMHYRGHCACCEGYDMDTYNRQAIMIAMVTCTLV